MAYIYKITNKLNGKSYIGKTELNNPIDRYKEHIADSKKERNKKRPLYSAMNKYGIENFLFEILEETNEPNEREVFYIEKFDTYGNKGYNATRGGDGKSYINPKVVIECYSRCDTFLEVATILGISPETVSKILKNNNVEIKGNLSGCKKTVLQLDRNTNEILAYYPSLSEAARAIGGKARMSNITEVCQGKRKTAYGYKWKLK